MQVCTAVFLHFVGLRQGGSDICPLNPQLLWIGNLDFWAWGFWASSKSIESLFEMGPESVREGQPKVVQGPGRDNPRLGPCARSPRCRR